MVYPRGRVGPLRADLWIGAIAIADGCLFAVLAEVKAQAWTYAVVSAISLAAVVVLIFMGTRRGASETQERSEVSITAAGSGSVAIGGPNSGPISTHVSLLGEGDSVPASRTPER